MPKPLFERLPLPFPKHYLFRMPPLDPEFRRKLDMGDKSAELRDAHLKAKLARSEGSRPSQQPDPSDPKSKAEQDIHSYGEQLAAYLADLLLHPGLTPFGFEAIIRFLGISTPFCKARYQKVAELWVYKYSRGRKNDHCLVRGLKSVFNRKQKRWLCIGYNNIWYYHLPSDEPSSMRDNVMIDGTTELKVLAMSARKVKLELTMSRRSLRLGIYDGALGLVALRSLLKAFTRSHYSTMHRFASFAPIRTHNDCKLFVDGEGYFEEVYQRIKSARDEIMICGWYISPEIPLLRPLQGSIHEENSRLDKLLQEAANRGVRVYVLVYKEFELEMYNDSQHCKDALERLNNKNIKVLQHPTSILQAVLWSHHEKMVIFDRKVVMMGGLDLAWGRWDTQAHDLFDFHDRGSCFPGYDYYNSYKREFPNNNQGSLFSSLRLDESFPRMPWHDVALRLKGPVVFDYLTHFVTYWNNSRELNKDSEVLFTQLSLTDPTYYISNSIKNLLNEKIGKKNIIQHLIDTKLKIHTGKSKQTFEDNDPQVGLQASLEPRRDPRLKAVLEDIGEEPVFTSDVKFFEPNLEEPVDPKEFAKFYSDTTFKTLDLKYELFKYLTPEEDKDTIVRKHIYDFLAEAPPSADLKSKKSILPSKPEPAEEASADLMHSLHKKKKDKPAPKPKTFEDILKVPGLYNLDLIPKDKIATSLAPENKSPEEDNENYYVEDDDKIPEEGEIRLNFKQGSYNKKSKDTGAVSTKAESYNITMQALRSASPWSIGLKSKEISIQNCYIETIMNAKHFIYIENQFFISSTSPKTDSDSVIRNRIAKAIYNRIKLAIDLKEDFKVIVFMPLMPAFEADLRQKQGEIMQITIGLENATIGKGKNSLFGKLRELTDCPERYIMVCALRRWQYPPSKVRNPKTKRYEEDRTKVPATEIIYIHSKVLSTDAAAHRRRPQTDHGQREPQRPQHVGLTRQRARSVHGCGQRRPRPRDHHQQQNLPRQQEDPSVPLRDLLGTLRPQHQRSHLPELHLLLGQSLEHREAEHRDLRTLLQRLPLGQVQDLARPAREQSHTRRRLQQGRLRDRPKPHPRPRRGLPLQIPRRGEPAGGQEQPRPHRAGDAADPRTLLTDS